MRFNAEEFDVMVNELLFSDPVSFDMLCRIADKTLRPYIALLCKNDSHLCGRGFEDDIIQEVHLRLMKTTIHSFLLRKDVKGSYNNDPEGFEDWMFTVAGNLKRDFAAKVRARDFNTQDNKELSQISDCHDRNAEEDRLDRLKQAFSIVISSDVSVYKVLTWIAQFIFVLDSGVTKIESNEMIISAFEEKTLYQMYDMILAASKRISWIEIDKSQNEKILKELQKTRCRGVSYGETKYKDFFMKHNGKVSGKKSISDWVNRMNDMIKKRTSSEELKRAENKKRGSGDAPSDNR